MNDKFVGNLTFVRVYSGVLKQGDAVYVKSKRERIGRIVQMHANERQDIDEIRAGDIAACVGLKDVTTGDTLCDEKNIITLERMEFPDPVIQAVEPKLKLTKKNVYRVWLKKTLHSVFTLMKNLVRQLLLVWVSFRHHR